MGKRIFQFIRYLFDSIISIIYTYEYKCELCGEYLEEGDICEKCKNKIKLCKFPVVLNKNNYNVKCYNVSYYSGDITKLILNFKYKSNFRCGDILADFMIELIERENIRFDVVTFVPMTKSALSKRGYNQSKILAKIIGKKFGLPVIDCIEKVKETKDQIGLGSEERWMNVSKSFKLKSNKDIIKKCILLVDDVFTTGATTFFCSGEMLEKGAKKVIVLTVAKSRI
jgi:competence protein ComFC